MSIFSFLIEQSIFFVPDGEGSLGNLEKLVLIE